MHSTKHTPSETAFLLVALLRGMLSANRSRMDRHRAQNIGDEIAGNLSGMASSSGSPHEFISKIIDRFDWSPIHESTGGPVAAFLDESDAATLDLSGHQMESGAVMVPWTAIVGMLDIAMVRAILRTAAPFLGAAVTSRNVNLALFDGVNIEPPGKVPVRPGNQRLRIVTDRYIGFCTTLSPIAHGDFGERRGNTAAMRRELRYDLATGIPSEVPFVSAASVRGQLRRAAIEEMLLVVGLEKTEVNPGLMNALLSGGGLDAGATPPGIPVERRRKLRGFMPLIDAFGGTFDGQLMEGKLLVGDLLPLVRETAAFTVGLLTEEETASLPSAESITITRTATRKPDPELDVERDDRMIFSTEAIPAGTMMFCHIAIRGDGVSCPPMTAAAIQWAVEVWQKRGTVGAKPAAGFGQVEWMSFENAASKVGLRDRHNGRTFQEYLTSNREEIAEYLRTGRMPGEEDSEESMARTTKAKRSSKPKKGASE